MKDALGNTLAVGQLVLWNNMPVRITKLVPGASKTSASPVIAFEFTIFDPKPESIVRVVDPESEKLLNQAIGAS